MAPSFVSGAALPLYLLLADSACSPVRGFAPTPSVASSAPGASFIGGPKKRGTAPKTRGGPSSRIVVAAPHAPESSTTTTTTTTALFGKLWDKLGIDEDDELNWYLINCVAGLERDLLAQCRHATRDFSLSDVEGFAVPTIKKLRSHGKRNVVDTKVKFPGYVFCKIRMCESVYETLQPLDLCRSWMGTVNRRGMRKLPPAPCALNEHEVEDKGLEEALLEGTEQDEDGEEENDGKLKEAKSEDMLELYKGYTVDTMVKILDGNFQGEDGIVRRLKDGKIGVRLFTYGTPFDEWFEPGQLRAMTDLEVMRGLGGPDRPVMQDEFDVSIGRKPRERGGGRDLGGRGVARALGGPGGGGIGGGAGGGGGRNRRQDRVARGERGGRDLFGRTQSESKAEEDNWRRYRESQRAEARGGRPDDYDRKKDDKGENWGMKSRSSWGGGDSSVYGDVDGQWGRMPKSGRQERRERRQRGGRGQGGGEGATAGGIGKALDGEGDWSAFASSSKRDAKDDSDSSSADDDFFDSLMSELSESVNSDPSSSSSKSAGGGGGGGGGGAAASSSSAPRKGGNRAEEEDDFFASLMSDLSETLDDDGDVGDSASEQPGGAPSSSASDDDDDDDGFFASLESELGDILDSEDDDDFDVAASSKKSPTEKSKEPRSGVVVPADDMDVDIEEEDDFFASLAAEATTSMPTPSSKSDADDDDDFFASLESDMLAALNAVGDCADGEAPAATVVAASAAKPERGGKKPRGDSSSSSTPPSTGGAPPPNGDLSKLTVPLLKERLRERGLKVSGRKAELIERLQEAGV